MQRSLFIITFTDPNGKKSLESVQVMLLLERGNELLNELKDQGATPMPCAGRCDEMVLVQSKMTSSLENIGSLLIKLPTCS